jgi:hypothetical protein
VARLSNVTARFARGLSSDVGSTSGPTATKAVSFCARSPQSSNSASGVPTPDRRVDRPARYRFGNTAARSGTMLIECLHGTERLFSTAPLQYLACPSGLQTRTPGLLTGPGRCPIDDARTLDSHRSVRVFRLSGSCTEDQGAPKQAHWLHESALLAQPAGPAA